MAIQPLNKIEIQNQLDDLDEKDYFAVLICSRDKDSEERNGVIHVDGPANFAANVAMDFIGKLLDNIEDPSEARIMKKKLIKQIKKL